MGLDSLVDIAYGCCVGSTLSFTKYVEYKVKNRPLTALWHQASIAVAYNQILDSWCNTSDAPDILVLLHDDLEIVDSDVEQKLVEAFEDDGVEMVGVVGSERAPDTLNWWDYGLVGQQHAGAANVHGERTEGSVRAVDGSFIALSYSAITEYRFDTRYSGFHGYDVDIARQVHAGGGKIAVAPIRTQHHTSIGFKSPAIEASWQQANLKYVQKWSQSEDS